MLTDLRSAPVIDNCDTFSPQARSVLDPQPVTIGENTAVWIELGGSMFANEDEYNVLAGLLPVTQLTTASRMAKEDDRYRGFENWDHLTDKVILTDATGTGLLESLAIICEHTSTKTLAAHVFNGYANEIIIFENGETLHEVMDTVVTMFAVVGKSHD